MASLTKPLYVLGGGSMGLLFAASIRLKNPLFPVTLLLRPGTPKERLRKYDQDLIIDGLSNRVSLKTSPRFASMLNQGIHASNGTGFILAAMKTTEKDMVNIVDIPAEILSQEPHENTTEETIKRVLVCTKAQDVSRAIDSITHRFEPNAGTEIFILSNGILAIMEELHGKNIPAQIISASTTHGAHRGDESDFSHVPPLLRPSCWNVVHAGFGAMYLEKSDRNNDESDSLGKVLLASCLNPILLSREEMKMIHWKKLVANCTINPLTALRRCLNGQILAGNEIKPRYMDSSILHELVLELSQLAQAELESHSEALSCEHLLEFVYDVVRKTAHNRSSMLQDIDNGRSTEIDYLNSYVVNLGRKKYGLPMDANDYILHEVRRLECSVIHNKYAKCAK
jgi:2-dehydropantoate 2-reductase